MFLFLAAGASAGGVKSCTTLVEMANREGTALELKDYDWASWDASTISQEELDWIAKNLGEFFQTKTKAELLQAGLEKGIWLMPVATVKDLVESPQLAAREFWAEVEHPELGETITYPGFPIKMSELAPYQPQRAPVIGEHNQEVYQELGLSEQELILLKSRGVI